jgi:hypothetical protein
VKAKLLRLFVCGCAIVMPSYNLSFKQRERVFEIVGKDQRLLVKPAPTNQQQKLIRIALLIRLV